MVKNEDIIPRNVVLDDGNTGFPNGKDAEDIAVGGAASNPFYRGILLPGNLCE